MRLSTVLKASKRQRRSDAQRMQPQALEDKVYCIHWM